MGYSSEGELIFIFIFSPNTASALHARAREVEVRGLGILQAVQECERARALAPASDHVARALHTSTSGGGGGAATGLEFSRRENNDGGQEMTSLKVCVTTGNTGGKVDRYSGANHLC